MRLAMVVAALVLVSSALAVSFDSDADAGDSVLFDRGNGQTDWIDAGEGTYAEVMSEALSSVGSDIEFGDGISVDGRTSAKIGDVSSSWRVYSWNGVSWDDISGRFDPSSAYGGGCIALGFYPEGLVPTETPDYRTSWTMVRGDALSTGGNTAQMSEAEGSVEWKYSYGNANYVCSTVLVEGRHAYVVAGGGYTSTMHNPTLYCYDRFTGEEEWKFEYGRGSGYETATGAIVGDRIYLPATEGKMYSIPLSGPGDGNSEVRFLEVSNKKDHDLVGSVYATGPASPVYDSGVLYFGSSSGYLYCTDLDLNVIWKSPLGGRGYFMSPTVSDGVVYYGALDGVLYAFDQATGDLLATETVFTIDESKMVYGSANTPVIIGDVIMLSFSDGRGMNSLYGGIAAYRFDGSDFTEVFKTEEPGLCSNNVLPVVNDGFRGVYALSYDGLFRMSVDGEFELLRSLDESFKAPLTMVNGDTIFATTYSLPGKVYTFDLDGNITGVMERPEDVDQFTMDGVVVIDGMIYNGTDGGMFAYSGKLPAPASGSGTDSGMIAAIVIAVIIVLVIAVLFYIKKVKGVPPIAYIRGRMKEASGFSNDRTSKVKKNKRRLLVVLLVGAVLAFILFSCSLMFGPSGNYSFFEALGYFKDGLLKTISGDGLTYDETIVFDSRGSRAVAVFAVGIGLSISGSIYQAIIRNPMVDPYIMGVSAGAGVAAVATIAFNFTFFGLLDNVTYVTPIVAMIGGLVAFGCTMVLAEKSGGSSINYVLAGVIIGLVFSAVQTLMLNMAGDKLNSAMSWLFGSFANISWDQAILVAVPSIAISLVPLVWAKEFNLVLLGEDQARQMGLDVRRFNRWMLILASVLASVCVAFVGIIGFVGLVVPHLCRMILGGDHRLVMPASIVVGAALMLAADLFAKMVMSPIELPVGAITTVIGAPVFAYLLIKKGRMYDG